MCARVSVRVCACSHVCTSNGPNAPRGCGKAQKYMQMLVKRTKRQLRSDCFPVCLHIVKFSAVNTYRPYNQMYAGFNLKNAEEITRRVFKPKTERSEAYREISAACRAGRNPSAAQNTASGASERTFRTHQPGEERCRRGPERALFMQVTDIYTHKRGSFLLTVCSQTLAKTAQGHAVLDTFCSDFNRKRKSQSSYISRWPG